MSSYPDESTSEHEEELPFALSVDPTLPPNAREDQDRHLQALVQSSLASSSWHNAPPGLASSLLSTPTDGESQASAASDADSFMAGNGSFFKNSQLLDAAASIFHPASSLLNISLDGISHDVRSSTLGQSTAPNVSSTTYQSSLAAAAAPANGAPISSFSTLLLAADDQHHANAAHGDSSHRGVFASTSQSQLSALEEEQDQSTAPASASASYITASVNRRTDEESGELISSAENYGRQDSSFFASFRHSSQDEHHPGSQTIVPAAARLASSPSVGSPRLFRTEERRLATLAGATATQTGPASFRVSVDLSPSCSSVRDVMEVVGNPDLLLLWCDPVTDLVILRSSEGARDHSLSGRNPTLHSRPSDHSNTSQSGVSAASGREYEGEWTEATTSRLLSPPNTSCVYSTSRAVSAALGFPSYGKLVMFVERARGQMSLTVGPFPGGIELLYKIRVDTVHGGRIRIEFDVALRPAPSHDSYERICVCGLWDFVEKCLLPSTDDYMDQTLSSAARLRFLVENGEGRSPVGESLPSGHPDFHGVSTEPLLLA